jgi:hypothetical protein
MEFERPHHRAIAKALRSLNAELFTAAECFFGGGTAIVLRCGEYRESVDIDFLCSNEDGYRTLSETTWGLGVAGLLRPGSLEDGEIKELRELRRMRDKFVCVLGVQSEGSEVSIKFEIVREARISLSGNFDENLGVPVLSDEHMYAEKLLANVDRGDDRSTLSRDIIDLALLQLRVGPVPKISWEIVERSYGIAGREAYEKSVLRIRNRSWLERCTREMQMNDDIIEEILTLHGGELPKEPSPFDD